MFQDNLSSQFVKRFKTWELRKYKNNFKTGRALPHAQFPLFKKSKKKNPTYQSIYICFGLNTVKETFMLEKLLVTGFCICKVGSSLSPEQYWVFRHTAVLIIFGKSLPEQYRCWVLLLVKVCFRQNSLVGSVSMSVTTEESALNVWHYIIVTNLKAMLNMLN